MFIRMILNFTIIGQKNTCMALILKGIMKSLQNPKRWYIITFETLFQKNKSSSIYNYEKKNSLFVIGTLRLIYRHISNTSYYIITCTSFWGFSRSTPKQECTLRKYTRGTPTIHNKSEHVYDQKRRVLVLQRCTDSWKLETLPSYYRDFWCVVLHDCEDWRKVIPIAVMNHFQMSKVTFMGFVSCHVTCYIHLKAWG